MNIINGMDIERNYRGICATTYNSSSQRRKLDGLRRQESLKHLGTLILSICWK